MMLMVMLLNLPADGAGTEHGSAGAVKTADQELCLVLKDVHHVLIVGALDGLHDQVAGFHHAAEEDKCLGRAEGCKVSASLAEHLAGELIDFLGQLVALAGGNADVE